MKDQRGAPGQWSYPVPMLAAKPLPVQAGKAYTNGS